MEVCLSDRYIVYSSWGPPVTIERREVNELILRRPDVDIWIREPDNEYYCSGVPLRVPPEPRLDRLCKLILRQCHKRYLLPTELFMAVFGGDGNVPKELTKLERLRVHKELWSLRKLFDISVKGRWRDDPFVRLVIVGDFTYCLVEPLAEMSLLATSDVVVNPI